MLLTDESFSSFKLIATKLQSISDVAVCLFLPFCTHESQANSVPESPPYDDASNSATAAEEEIKAKSEEGTFSVR
jgi:hypothetical protein